MQVNANVQLNNREIGANFKLVKEEGENDFFSNLLSGSSEVDDIVDDEDEAFGDE